MLRMWWRYYYNLSLSPSKCLCHRLWQGSLQGHSRLSFERLWCLRELPEGWKKQKSILSLRKTRTASQPHLDACDRANNPENYFQTWRTRRWFGIVSINLWRGNHAWPTWWLSAVRWLCQSMRGEQWMLFVSALAGLLTLVSPGIPIDKLMKCQQWGWLATGWTARLKGLWSAAQSPDRGSH